MLGAGLLGGAPDKSPGPTLDAWLVAVSPSWPGSGSRCWAVGSPSRLTEGKAGVTPGSIQAIMQFPEAIMQFPVGLGWLLRFQGSPGDRRSLRKVGVSCNSFKISV